MKNFVEAVNFKRATLTYMASKLPEKHLQDLRQIFISIDVNGDGKIDSSEFETALSQVGLKFSIDEIKDFVNKVDTNANGFIDYTEFLAGCMRSKIYLKEDHLR
jgi:calcium-dependent protein kinase